MQQKEETHPLEDQIPNTLGHIWTPDERRAFLHIAAGNSIPSTAKALNIPPSRIHNWKRKEWWIETRRKYLEAQQEDFENGLNNIQDEILAGYRDVMQNRDVRTAMARVSGAKLFMEHGNNPMIKKTPSTLIQNNVNMNPARIDPEKVKELSQADLIEIARTNIIPESIKVVSPDDKDQ
jgi:predicted ATP-dependent endonuclease of OLD family